MILIIRRYVLVFGLLLLLVFDSAALDSVQMTAALETEGSNQSLDLRSIIDEHNSDQNGQATANKETHALV